MRPRRVPLSLPIGEVRFLRDLDASAFAFVMATGIVSVAARFERLPALSEALLVVAVVAWVVLAVAVSVRTLATGDRRPRLESFAVVAATAVLAARFAVAGSSIVALALWSLAIVEWVVLLACRPQMARPDGGWFLVVVGTESLAVSAALLAPRWSGDLLPAAIGWWALGLCLYPFVAAAIAGSLRRQPRFGPDLWVTMGALAISTLAGSELLLAARTLGSFNPLHAWLRAADIGTWAVASAWIVPLIAAEFRHRDDWRYRSSLWSFVFPLGMYSVSTQTLARVVGLAPLVDVGRAFFVAAAAAWVIVLVGLGRRMVNG